MKAKTFITAFLIGWVAFAVTRSTAQTTISGDLLNIGSANKLAPSSLAGITYDSIAGGAQNTNNGMQFTVIAGGLNNYVPSNSLVAVYYSAISGGVANKMEGKYGVIAGGAGNLILKTNGLPTNPLDQNLNDYSVIGGGAYNTVLTVDGVICGGYGNVIDAFGGQSVISGGVSNIIGYASGYSTISGGTFNEVSKGAWWGTINGGSGNEIEGLVASTNDFPSAHYGWIGGGRLNYIKLRGTLSAIGAGNENEISGYASTIGGGDRNIIVGDWSVVGGGRQNFALTNAEFCFIGGGDTNLIEPGAQYGSILGGVRNVLGTNSTYGAVAGGYSNLVGRYAIGATVAGGFQNTAGTNYTFAAGTRANAAHVGSFVWADASVGSVFSSTADNQFSVRSYGGAKFQSGASTGVALAAGGGSWSSLSDRSAKTNFAPINARAILDRVKSLPLSTWNYKSQSQEIRHIGPMAQDFSAAFQVGENDKTITTIDADGVALAAIQGLNELLEEKDSKLNGQEAQLKRQGQLIESLSERLRALERAVVRGEE